MDLRTKHMITKFQLVINLQTKTIQAKNNNKPFLGYSCPIWKKPNLLISYESCLNLAKNKLIIKKTIKNNFLLILKTIPII